MVLWVFWLFSGQRTSILNDAIHIFFLICFYVCHMYKYFLGFLEKTSSPVFVRSHSRKSMRTQLSILLSSFRTLHGNTKSETCGVSFKFFSRTVKMKILSSDLVLFTLVKVFEENVWWAIIYHFFGLIKIIYKKGTERFLFKCFSDSLNMKNPRVFSLWNR